MMWAWPVALATVVGVAWAMSGVAFTANRVTEHFWLLYADLGPDAPVVEGIHLPLVLLFVLAAASFIPLGQFVGTRLEIFRARSSALWGYAFDLGGSLLGVLAFAAISGAGLKPVFWFAPALVVGMLLLAGSKEVWTAYAVWAITIMAIVYAATGNARFSPYYALEVVDGVDGRSIVHANGSVHQVATDMVREQGDRKRLTTVLGYRYPYAKLGRPIRKALVLGAGSGNDVAVLLQQGAQEIHAVEIDPEIIAIGRTMHPNDPYSSPRVTIHNTDARSFLNDSEEYFDVVVFGTLDSMTRLSALSNVRLDNFVYTREALEAARDRLTPDGGLILYFMVGQQHIADHLTALLAHTFRAVPEVHLGDYALFNTVFMAGPAYVNPGAIPDPDAWYFQDDIIGTVAPSDDWPYLYLPGRGVNGFYLSMMGILAGIAAALILAVSPEMREAFWVGKRVDVEMFLYGFAFLLIETKFVTAMNLVWGATWLTSAVVFGSILAVILVGTILTEQRPISLPVAGVGLLTALLVAYALPLHLLLSTAPATRLVLSTLFVGTPILFASLCFAVRFKSKPAADLAFGWNLLGAVLGGLTEFFSMAVGFRALTLVALAAYLGSFVLARRSFASTKLERVR